MSTFGSPGGRNVISKPVAPERGSFPLDHDNECKTHMTLYLTCLRKSRGINQDDCRMLSKAYLQCRMDRNLMAVDEMKNLGFDAGVNTPVTKEEVHERYEGVRRERREGEEKGKE